MAVLIDSGTNAIDLAIAGTYRQDISDLLLAPLWVDPSYLGILQTGEGFSGNAAVCNWNEEALNPSQFADLTSGGISPSDATIKVTAAQANALDVGNILADTSAAVGGLQGSERVQIIAKGVPTGSPATVLLTISRGVAPGPAAQTHAQGAVWQLIGQPIGMNSDLGPDKTLPRIPKYNYIQREDINVNLGSEVIDSSLLGYTPGIPNEFTHQIMNRVLEKLIVLDVTALYGLGSPGDGTSGVTAGNNSTQWGAIPMLNGTYNSTSTVIDFSSQFGVGQMLQLVNYVNGLAYAAGVRLDYIVCGVGPALALAQVIPQDQIRLVQDESTRGFSVRKILTGLGNELQIIIDPYISAVNGAADMLFIDSGRIRNRPYENEWMTLITSPSFRDGDAARMLIKFSNEVRNTGTDTGQAHYLVKNVSF